MKTNAQVMVRFDALELVDKLLFQAFEKPRDARSGAYKRGVRELLKSRALKWRLTCPYTMGTAEADAFYSGVDEGNAIWRAHESKRAPGA